MDLRDTVVGIVVQSHGHAQPHTHNFFSHVISIENEMFQSHLSIINCYFPGTLSLRHASLTKF